MLRVAAVKRAHEMPFGAQALADGRVRFRLWAPAAERVELLLHGAGPHAVSELAPEPDGWFCLETDEAAPGTRYSYRVDRRVEVPDPASRYQPADVHGPSEVVDPGAFEWRDGSWTGRPWEEAVLYELHVGAFSATGDLEGVAARLDYLADLGVTALELMPLSDFPGARNWGYDGVLPFAPDASYGRPEALKSLVQAAHARGLMVFLDVVYNHFGPDGNYLHAYAPAFFSERHHTPWGAAVNFDGPRSGPVREFFIHNALYWLEEYHLDGLRLDAVHAILDDSTPDILTELARRVRAGPGAQRRVHLVLENDDNAARYMQRGADGRVHAYDAQWNDDVHHGLHVLLSGERDGYYEDYADAPARHTARALSEGFAYQGEPSRHRGGRPRGEPSAFLPPTAFVSFLQNHDQVGNRAHGERIDALAPPEAVRAAALVRLLAPSPPLLFMGEEWAAETPFQYFCDFEGELAAKVAAGRREEFASFARFADPQARAQIPDPNDPGTFARSRLDWQSPTRAAKAERLELYKRLLALRRERIVPLLAGARGGAAGHEVVSDSGFVVRWRLDQGALLTLIANLGPEELDMRGVAAPRGELLHACPEDLKSWLCRKRLPPWSGACFLDASAGG